MYFGTTSRLPVLRVPFNGSRQVNRLLDEAIQFLGADATVAPLWTPACDIIEDSNRLKIQMELPGVAADQVKLSLENDHLTIRGEKRQSHSESTERYHRIERSYGGFERVFALPATIDAAGIEAAMDNGVLVVSVPKVERARPREIQVTGPVSPQN